MKKIILMLTILLPCIGCVMNKPNIRKVDICIYGGTASGVIAAYSAKKMGKTVLLIEPKNHIGGMTTGGLGETDIGNKQAITGLSRLFYQRIGEHYNKEEQWTFPPSVASKVMDRFIHEAELDILREYRAIHVNKKNTTIQSIMVETLNKSDFEAIIEIRAKQFIDCSYEGDLMALAGVTYTTGRESNDTYDETWSGVQLPEYRKRSGHHQFPDHIDPYVIPGNPESGLLWGISPNKLEATGSADQLIQAYNFRICLTNDPKNRIPITEPDNYNPDNYELLIRLFEAQKNDRDINQYFIWSLMPDNKTDINNRGAFSTDMIGANHNYPEASHEEREKIIKEHIDYTKGLLYFYLTDPRVPVELQSFVSEWGYPKDEYIDNDHWSPQLYIRESRRMVGEYVMTEANCTGKEVVDDAIGLAAYTMDSHNCQRIVVEEAGKYFVKNEGNVEIGGFKPYPISYRSLLPKATECSNLIVPVCLSASHIAYGSIRMEPVFMVLGQSAGVAASLAIEYKTSVHDLDVQRIQEILTDNPTLDK